MLAYGADAASSTPHPAGLVPGLRPGPLRLGLRGGRPLDADPLLVSAERELADLVDRKALAARGLSRASIDLLFERLPVVAYPGSRKVYLRRADVLEYEAQHTYDGRTRVRRR